MRRCRTRGLPLNSQVAAKHWFLVILFYSQESFSILFSIPVEIEVILHTRHLPFQDILMKLEALLLGKSFERTPSADSAERIPTMLKGCHWAGDITDIIIYIYISSTGTSRAAHAAHAALARSGVPSKDLFVAELRNVQKVRLFSGEAPGKIQAISFQIGTDKTKGGPRFGTNCGYFMHI